MCALLIFSPLQAQWTTQVSLSDVGFTETGAPVVIDSFGNTTALWRIRKTINGTEYDVIQSSTKPFGSDWGPIEDVFIDSSDLGILYPQLVVDPLGNLTAIAAIKLGGSEWGLQYWTKPFGGTWQASITIPGVNMGGSVDPQFQMAIDSQGNIGVIWTRLDTNNATWMIQGVTKPLGNDWLTAENIKTGINEVYYFKFAFDPFGNAFAIWHEYVMPGISAIFTSTKYSNSSSWDSPTMLSSIGGSITGIGIGMLSIAFDRSGNAMVGWIAEMDSSSYVQTRMKLSGNSNWEPVETILDTSRRASDIPQITFDNEGNATVIWEGAIGLNTDIRSSYRSAGGAWQSPLSLSSIENQANSPRSVVDPFGNVTALWKEFNGSYWIAKSAYKSFDSSEWQSPIEIGVTSELLADGGGALINAATDFNGNIVVTWREMTVSGYQFSSVSYLALPRVVSLSSSTGPKKGGDEVIITGSSLWNTSSVLFGTVPASFTVNSPTSITAIAPPGSGIIDVVITSPLGSSTSSSATKYMYLLVPPTHLRGKFVLHAFSSQVEYMHRLSWKASPDADVTKYLVYRDGSLFKTVLADKPLVVKARNLKSKKRVEYRVVAYDDSGIHSEPVTITIK